MGTRRSTPERRIGLFVEGTSLLTKRGRDDLMELWRYQCSKVSEFPPDRIDVYGFTKQQIVIMAPAHATMPGTGKIPLDVTIEQKFKDKPFDALIIAFDAHPANQAIELVEGQPSPCLRIEKDFVLHQLMTSEFLPQQFRDGAAKLLAYYHVNRGRPRATTRPPIGEVELVYMDPTFEALLLQDEAALRMVFGLKRVPNTWCAIPHDGDRPDFEIRKIVNGNRKRGPNHLRVQYDAKKHAWAQEILKNASENSAIWEHAIIQRLKKVLS